MQCLFTKLHPLGVALIFAMTIVICPPTRTVAQPTVELEEIVVSGGRTPLESNLFGRAHTVLTREELESRQVRTVGEALRLVPGVNVSRQGPGDITQVRMRGTEGNHVLVLVDGIEVSDPNLDEFYWDAVPVGFIEKIEVIRGPQSALWGSNALAGVISITTTDAEAPTRGHFEVGTNNSFNASANASFHTERTQMHVSATYQGTEGHDISGSGGEDDGYDTFTPALAIDADLTETVSFTGRLRYLDRDTEFDNSGGPGGPAIVDQKNNENNREEWFGALQLSINQPNSAFRLTPRLEQTRVDRENLGETDFGSWYSTWKNVRTHASTQVDIALDGSTPDTAPHLLSLVGEWEKSKDQTCTASCDSPSPEYRKLHRTTRSVATELRVHWSEMYWQFGGRLDFNDRFEDARTWSASVSVPFSSLGTRFHSSVGTAVTNPTFDEQFGRYWTPNFIGNPDLQPENSRGWDVGIEQTLPQTTVVADLTWFYQKLEDKITLFGNTVTNFSGTSRRQGIELSVTWIPLDNLSLQANYTYTHSLDPSGTRETRRPLHLASLRAEAPIFHSDHRAHASLTYTGTQLDTDRRDWSNPSVVELPSMLVTNIGGTMPLNDSASLQWRIENLFDQEIQEVFGYHGAGREAFVGFRLQF